MVDKIFLKFLFISGAEKRQTDTPYMSATAKAGPEARMRLRSPTEAAGTQ